MRGLKLFILITDWIIFRIAIIVFEFFGITHVNDKKIKDIDNAYKSDIKELFK